MIEATLCFILCIVAPAIHAATAPNSNRFLFIIETSAAMKPLETQVKETVFDLLFSGARGRMTNGDTYGVWLIGEQNDTSFPMEVWKEKHNIQLAAKAATHVKDHAAKGKARWSVAITDMLRVVKQVEDLTVILVSSGDVPISGTPFDSEINARILEVGPEMKRTKFTVNIALVAQNGELTAWGMNSPGFLLEVPVVAPKPKPVKVEVVVANTNAPLPEAIAATSTNASFVAKPRVTSTPIIITKETIAQEKRSYLSFTTNSMEPEPAPAVAPTNSVVTTAPATVATTNVQVAAATKTNASLATIAPQTSATNVTAQIASASLAETVNDSEPISDTTTQQHTPALSDLPQPVQGSGPIVWIAVGAGAMLVCVLIFQFALRRRSPGASLISQAIAREKLSYH